MCSIRKLCDPIARMNIRLFFKELLVTSARYHKVLITFGFKSGGEQTKTGDNETKNKKAK